MFSQRLDEYSTAGATDTVYELAFVLYFAYPLGSGGVDVLSTVPELSP